MKKVHGLCYQPSCHGCYHLDITFECVATTTLLQNWKQIIQYLLRDAFQRNVENQSTCIN